MPAAQLQVHRRTAAHDRVSPGGEAVAHPDRQRQWARRGEAHSEGMWYGRQVGVSCDAVLFLEVYWALGRRVCFCCARSGIERKKLCGRITCAVPFPTLTYVPPASFPKGRAVDISNDHERHKEVFTEPPRPPSLCLDDRALFL